MTVEFCGHLEDYGKHYMVAEAAYRQMLGRLDVVMREQSGDQEHVLLLEDAVEEWEREVRYLRDLFLIYVRRGDIGLPARSQDGDRDRAAAPAEVGDPECAVCGMLVPRLCWREWRVDDRRASYRDTPFLKMAEPQPEPAA